MGQTREEEGRTHVLDLLDAELLQASAAPFTECGFGEAQLGVLQLEHAVERRNG